MFYWYLVSTLKDDEALGGMTLLVLKIWGWSWKVALE